VNLNFLGNTTYFGANLCATNTGLIFEQHIWNQGRTGGRQLGGINKDPFRLGDKLLQHFPNYAATIIPAKKTQSGTINAGCNHLFPTSVAGGDGTFVFLFFCNFSSYFCSKAPEKKLLRHHTEGGGPPIISEADKSFFHARPLARG